MAKETVLYISTHGIQVIQGTCDKSDMITILDFKEIPLDEGVMINGVITDDATILEEVKKLHEQGMSHTRLLIDSGQILVKDMEVPVLKEKELRKIVVDELSNLQEGYEDLIYDYSVLKTDLSDQGKSGGQILCCGVERKLIDSYLDIFDAADIKVDSIDISVNALLKLTQELSDLQDHTYIVSVLDANNVSSYLFENNQYTFSNRTRLFSERGTPGFINEMNSNISQLIQFSKSKQSPYTIETAFFCGLAQEEEPLVFKSIEESLEIKADHFPNSKMVYLKENKNEEEFKLHDYVYSIGCMIRK